MQSCHRQHRLQERVVSILSIVSQASLKWTPPKGNGTRLSSVDWFSKPEARKEVLQLLAEFRLDEFAIEAEAIRSVFSELEVLDRMLTLLESRRNKALRSIADYRDGFAKQVREVSNRVIEADPVIQLENQAARRSA